jgi:hypothetical protein
MELKNKAGGAGFCAAHKPPTSILTEEKVGKQIPRQDLKSIGQAMRIARRGREKTLDMVMQEIRKRTGMRAHISQLSNIENGKTAISMRFFVAYANAIGIPASELLRSVEVLEQLNGN